MQRIDFNDDTRRRDSGPRQRQSDSSLLLEMLRAGRKVFDWLAVVGCRQKPAVSEVGVDREVRDVMSTTVVRSASPAVIRHPKRH